jgi:hypothetical protein
MTLKTTKQANLQSTLGITSSTSTCGKIDYEGYGSGMVQFNADVTTNLTEVAVHVSATPAGTYVPAYDGTSAIVIGSVVKSQAYQIPDSVKAAGGVQLVGNHADSATYTVMKQG